MSTGSAPVTVVIACSIRPDKVAMARRELEAVIATVMANEPGCHGIRVHDDPADPRRLLIIEHWESKEVFTGPHMETPHMRAFLETAEEFLDGKAEFGFWREIHAANKGNKGGTKGTEVINHCRTVRQRRHGAVRQ